MPATSPVYHPDKCPACGSLGITLVKPAEDETKVVYVDRKCDTCGTVWSPRVSPTVATFCTIIGGGMSILLVIFWRYGLSGRADGDAMEGIGFFLGPALAVLTYGVSVLTGKAGQGRIVQQSRLPGFFGGDAADGHAANRALERGDEDSTTAETRTAIEGDSSADDSAEKRDQSARTAAPRHSRIGIAAFIASLLPYACFFLISEGQVEASSPLAVPLLAGSFGGPLLAFGLGVMGLFRRDRKRIFAIFGTTIATLTILGMISGFVILSRRDDDPVPAPAGPFADPPGAVTNSIGMKFVPIAAGEFLMGSPEGHPLGDPREQHQHLVRITRPFLLGMHEVTQGQYQQVTGSNPSHFQGADLPVEHLSWKEARGFCEVLSSLPDEQAAGRRYRLPTEAEWEYACRAGTSTAFNVGEELGSRAARFAHFVRRSPKQTAPVGTYPPNAWGLFEMHGNVWEWTNDWFSADYFRESPIADPQGPDAGTHHTLRGGSASVMADDCHSAFRGEASEQDGPKAGSWYSYANHGDFGIRVVCECETAANAAPLGTSSIEAEATDDE